MSLALEQPRLAPVQPWGCPRARDIFGSLRPSPEKTTCSFPYRFLGKSRNSGLVPGNRDPNTAMHSCLKCTPQNETRQQTNEKKNNNPKIQRPANSQPNPSPFPSPRARTTPLPPRFPPPSPTPTKRKPEALGYLRSPYEGVKTRAAF